MDEIKSNCSIFSTLKKTRATYTADSSGEKDFKKLETERKLHNAESISNFNLKRRMEFSQTKLSLFPIEQKEAREARRQSTNPQRKQTENEIKQKQVSVDDILSKSLKLAKQCYDGQPDFAQFKLTTNNRNKIYDFNKKFKERIIQIIKDIKYKQKQLACHLNTIFFCRENIRLLSLTLIQKEIFKQWRENILLSSIKSQWLVCLQEYLPSFQSQGYVIFSEIIYEDFCLFMSHLTFLIFEAYYQHKLQIEGMQKQDLIQRLNKRTMRYVVTQSSQWQNIICLHIEELLMANIKYERLTDQVREKLINLFIEEMKIKPIHELLSNLHKKNEKLFPFTRQSIPRLLKQHYIPAKVKCILNVRVALQQDIIQYQKILIEQQKLQNIEMLEKDPMLTCLILAVLSSEIDLSTIELALREIKLMLGPDYHEILNAQKCPSYYVDLTSVIEQLNIEIRIATKQLSKISS